MMRDNGPRLLVVLVFGAMGEEVVEAELTINGALDIAVSSPPLSDTAHNSSTAPDSTSSWASFTLGAVLFWTVCW